jgi:hypothetical protein
MALNYIEYLNKRKSPLRAKKEKIRKKLLLD